MSIICFMAARSSWSKVMIFVQTVQEFGCELLAQALLNDGTGTLLVLLVLRNAIQIGCCEAHALPKFLQLTGSCVGRHDDDGVAEVYQASVAISQSAFVEHLQEHVEYVSVRLFNLV